MASAEMTDRFDTLAGATAVVVQGTSPIGQMIAAGLTDHGARVGVVGDDITSREEYERAFARVGGDPPSVFVVPVVAPSRPRRPLVELDLDEWTAQCEAPLRATRNAVQAAFASLAPPKGDGGVILLVAPTAALTGEAGLAAFATAAEGARAMARVVARGWGRHRIRLHWVGAPTALFTGEADAPRMAMWDPALGSTPDPRRDLASAIAALASPAMQFATGTTTVIDGGLVMPT
jgi:NAD(P)-dependent dehydrogenase (short-subunit alcohol dehydrogenase family)